MLIGAGSKPEPRIIGDVQEPVWPPPRIGHHAWKNRLVAYQYTSRRRPGYVERAQPRPCLEAPPLLRELPKPQRFEKALEGQIFAEGHQMGLVVGIEDRAIRVDHMHRVVVAE